ncbi:disease resistance protein RUN1-like [Prosopis cineraria]|uniref:disease resistance protein RUN1-like n=1 Tax=Prosopis cineraria TaxID=364024 RepID=UPI00240EDAF4|nr:disease resistance protein RUN1-like [Prosopis cineraria]
MNRLSLPSSSSSSSSRRTWKYEVFLSFRGEDTRNSFTGHLHAALQRKGIYTFKDDKKLQRGKRIRPELLKAIEQSRISIVVFSKNYADSSWCLDELAKICEGIAEPGYTVLPIFYDVDPSEVRNQRGDFEEAFNKHKQSSSDRVQRWKTALRQAADLSGYDVRNKSESDVIDQIVLEVTHTLKHRFSSLAEDLIGMQSRAEAFEKLLNLDSSDDHAQFVGILGMPGVGKTTLAAVVYDRISHQFDACCLLLDVSKVHKGPGLVRLQKQLLCEAVGKDQEVWEDHTGTNLIRTRLCNCKTLIVVDNVDHDEQLQKLVGKPEWFGPGSRIIITTRDEKILERHGVKVNKVYKVELLNDEEALQLLCRRAFKSDDPEDEFEELTHNLLQYSKALPLAIKVLGSSLFKRQQSEWRAQLDRLKENPNQEVMGVLETSLFLLEQSDKDIFLDVACFFKGEDENYARKILHHCGFNPELGINILCERSLMVIVNERIWMHDLLQELGWKFAKGEFPQEPAKWSRLWLYKDLQAVKTGTEKVEAIVLKEEDIDLNEMLPLRAEALSQMTRLRLIIFPHVKFSGKQLNNLSNDLRFLSWHKFPFSYLPSSFEPAELAELIMPDSNARLLWEGIKTMPKLKIMDLRGSKNLIKTPNLRGVKNLEKLDLEGCSGLLEVDASTGDLRKLTSLNLRNCDRLISIPNTLFLSTSLETLNLPGCFKLAQRLNFQGPR